MKGVNTLIAAVLLIAITLVITIVVSTTVTNLAKTESSSVQAKATTFVNCSASDIDIQAVYLNATVAKVTVRNSGQQRENLISGQVFNKTGGTSSAISTFPTSLGRGAITDLLFDITSNVSCASFSQAIVTTDCTVDFWDQPPKNC